MGGHTDVALVGQAEDRYADRYDDDYE